MADIDIEKEHSFDFETARGKAKDWLGKLEEKFGVSVEYTEGDAEDVAKVSHSGVDATATLTVDKVRFEAKLGFLAKPMKGKITEMVTEGLEKKFS